ncbi:protein ANTAGONIST OF LIKE HETEROCHROMATIN PROTEIN 1-like [Pieris napi]|uniref:protein ANTAGONIST OF LIKE HETEROCHROMATIN PROTEIN 1-like n=1 Tax=Pieris napi TaxID=78633 RepID=UPI001FB8DED1|nr:protein ANTAGONIST OF LIKE HETEROCHROMATIN PROTEIN 1-like [Pieris napi]
MLLATMFKSIQVVHTPVCVKMLPEEVVLLCSLYQMYRISNKKKRKRWWIRNYLLQRENLMSDLRMTDGSFCNFTRMSKSDFEHLLEMIGPSIAKRETNIRQPVSPQTRLAITLRYLATGDSYSSLSYTFRVSKQLISKIIPDVCQELINSLAGYVKVPSSEQEWKQISREFEIRWNFPHCIGAIDGKHVMIVAPNNSGSEYYNYKNQFSMVLMAIADGNYNFIYANYGAKGRSSDSGIFQETPFYNALLENSLKLPRPEPITQGGTEMPYVIVGDSAFALTENIMKPYPGIHERGNKKRIFNYRLSRARRIIENVFGILCVVFRVFTKPIPLKPANCELVVIAYVYLHNFLRRNSVSRSIYTPPETFDFEDSEGNLLEGSWRRERLSGESLST